MHDLLIHNGTVITEGEILTASIAITDGKIVEIGQTSGSAKTEIDAGNLHIFPGMIDPHVHFNEPGRTEWEGFATGSAAFSAGGGTCFFDMPLNSSPPTLDGPSFDLKLGAALAGSGTDFALWGGLTPNNLDKLEELAARGVIGFKAFMSNSGISDFERADDATLEEGMGIAAQLGLLVAVHAESEEMTASLTQKARVLHSPSTWEDYLNSRPIDAELEAIHRAIAIASKTKCRLHIVHVSSSAGAQIVRKAAADGIADVTCETCPHYLAMSIHDLEGLGAKAKCAPPLRSPAEVNQLWQDLADGKFAFIGSDHSPSPESMKQGEDPFAMWGGIAGIQSTLSILLSRDLPLTMIADLLSTRAADIFKIQSKGRLAVGADADLALVDVDATYELTHDMLLDRHKLSPYVGRTFRGVVHRTMVRGQTICVDGKSTGDFKPNFIKGAAHV